jgi:L-asparaginase II
VAVADTEGRLLFHCGDPLFRTHARSVLKPLQLIAVMESGAADAFSFSDRELAVMAGSHSGSSRHTEAVRGILSKIGLDESALECGTHHPVDQEEGKLVHEGKRALSPLHNNCSGKHAGMLAVCRRMGWDQRGYVSPSHPVQEYILDRVGRVMGVGAFKDMTLAIDGCGVPTPYVELKSLAVGFARLAGGGNGTGAGASGVGAGALTAASPPEARSPYAASLARIRQAMVREPFMVAGKDRLCTAIMTVLKEDVVSKGGGEAVYCAASRERGFGICVKVEDGTPRATGPAVIEAMRQLGVASERHVQELAEFSRPAMRNCRGEVVGEIRACLQLEAPVPARR